MTSVATKAITNYLDRAVSALRAIGINFPQESAAPVVSLLEKVAKYDNNKITSIAATLQQSSAFNAAIREQIGGMDISIRYADITESFTSIREDLIKMNEWMKDGKLEFSERMQFAWMKMRRGSIPDRFDNIRGSYLSVSRSAGDQIDRETAILQAYIDFRMALKSAEVDAQEVLKIASAALEERKAALTAAGAAVESYAGEDGAARSRLELARDEALLAVQNEDKSFQIVKDIADDLKTSYNTAELVFARLQQTHTTKERLHQRMIGFFTTNEIVFSGLEASFTATSGLAEATLTLESTKDGVNKGLEALATNGNDHLKAALKAGYGATLSSGSVKALADAVVNFQSESMSLIKEERVKSTETAQEIENAAEDGKRRFAALVSKAV